MLCGERIETCFYLFEDCHLVRGLTFSSRWGCWLNFWKVDSIHQHINLCINPSVELLEIHISRDWLSIFFSFLFYNV